MGRQEPLLKSFIGKGISVSFLISQANMDIIIRKGKPRGSTRSDVEKKLSKEGWGTGITEEQIDKCEYLEKELKDKLGVDKSFINAKDIDKVK